MSKSFKSKAINAVLTAIINTLIGWAKAWSNGAYFFIVIGDNISTDVAWYNTQNLAIEGAWTLANDIKAACAFADLSGSMNILLEDKLKDEEFRKEYELSMPEEDNVGWVSYEKTTKGTQKENER